MTQLVPKSKKPTVRIKRQKTSLGWAYRIYIDGAYAATGLTLASARDGAKRMLANRERINRSASARRQR